MRSWFFWHSDRLPSSSAARNRANRTRVIPSTFILNHLAGQPFDRVICIFDPLARGGES